MKRSLFFFCCLCLAVCGYTYGQAQTKTINFDDIDASHGRVVANIYLQKHGITLSGVTPGTIIVIDAAKNAYEGRAMAAASAPNFLSQYNSNDPVSFTLNFENPAQSVQFTRPLLIAGPTGITFPEWKATALNEKGEALDSAGESLGGYYKNEPARVFTLKGPGIKALRFDSNNYHFAAFSAVVIDDLILF